MESGDFTMEIKWRIFSKRRWKFSWKRLMLDSQSTSTKVILSIYVKYNYKRFEFKVESNPSILRQLL